MSRTPKSSQGLRVHKLCLSEAVYGNAHMLNLVELENAQMQQGRIRELRLKSPKKTKLDQSDGGAFETYIPKRQIKTVNYERLE